MRLSLRRFQLGVLAVALFLASALTLEQRHISFSRLSMEHAKAVSRLCRVEGAFGDQTRRRSPHQIELDNWHLYLADKYSRAANYPWLPVAEDLRAPTDPD
jgi:hypothetical protein